jgi:HK97 family phage major capsid protein
VAGPRLQALQRQFDELKAGIERINRAAIDGNRDLTPEEQADQDKLFERAETIKPEIEAEAKREGSIQATADVLAKVNGGTPTPINRAARPAADAPEMSAGEYLASYYRAYHPQHADAPEEFLERAARYIDRAQQATADTAGILPSPIVGQVVKLSDSRRPAFLSMTQRSMPPKGKTFERPRVTQRVTMATQTEGQALASQKMTLTSDTVTKATQGGSLDITQQDVDWSEPSALEIVVQDFVDMYTEWTEGLACDFLEGLIVAADAAVDGDGYSAYTTTNVGTIVTSYVNGIVNVYNRAKRFPDTIWLDLASWATLTSTTNTNNDRTALSMIKEALDEFGGSPVRWVVSPQFAADTRIIGASSLVEAYEQQKGLLRAEKPTTLVVELAYAGYTAFWGNYNGFVQLGTDPD